VTQATVDGVERYRAQIRITRLIYLGGAAFIGVIGAYFASVALLGPGWTPLSLLATVLAFLMAVVLAVGAVWKWAPGAIEVSVDGNGISFRYPSGRIRQVLWSGQGLPLTIQRTDGVHDEISRGRPVQAVSGRLWLLDFLSNETYHQLIAMAKKQGVSVTESPGLRAGWIRVILSIRAA